MFAHCLLPALLLLATVDYCTSQSDLNYKATEFKGRTDIPLNKKVNLAIPKKQCDGEIKPLSNYIKCDAGSIQAVQVTVRDSELKIEISISDDLKTVTILREKPCLDAATVDVEVGCASGSQRQPSILGLF